MKFRADLGHPLMQRRQDLAGLVRADAVDHSVIRVPLELDQRELPRIYNYRICRQPLADADGA